VLIGIVVAFVVLAFVDSEGGAYLLLRVPAVAFAIASVFAVRSRARFEERDNA
jgi:hypothetical protein